MPMRSRIDLLTAASILMALTAFIIWQSYEVRQSVGARFLSRAMLLQVQVNESALVIANQDQAYFRGCHAVVNKTFQLDEPFLLPAPGVGEFVTPRIRINLADFKQGDRAFQWSSRSRARLEISCRQYAPFANAGAAASSEAFAWEEVPARWVGRL